MHWSFNFCPTVKQYTGYYANPMQATVMQYGCREFSGVPHIVVYWVGPIIATVIAFHVRKQYKKCSSKTVGTDTTDAAACEASTGAGAGGGAGGQPTDATSTPETGAPEVASQPAAE